MTKWIKTLPKEQETNITIAYHTRTISLYTSRKSTAIKLKREIGEPSKIYFTKNEISGVTYVKKIDSKEAKKLLSKGILIGQIKSK